MSSIMNSTWLNNTNPKKVCLHHISLTLQCSLMGTKGFWWVIDGNLVGTKGFLIGYWWEQEEFYENYLGTWWNKRILMGCWWEQEEFDRNCLGTWWEIKAHPFKKIRNIPCGHVGTTQSAYLFKKIKNIPGACWCHPIGCPHMLYPNFFIEELLPMHELKKKQIT